METPDQTLAQILERQAHWYDSRVFLRDKSNRRWCDHSWNSVADRAARLRAGLHSMGIKHGDRVAILCDNSPEWVIVDMAALGLGAIVVPLYTTGGAEETRHVLADSGARLLALDSAQRLDKIRGLGSLPALETIVLTYQAPVSHQGAGPRIVSLEQANGCDP